MKRREALAFAGLGFAAFCWGSATTVTKYALDSFGPMTLLFIELAAANVALWAVLIVRGVHRPQGMARVLIVGILEPGLCEAFIAVGLTSTSAANAAILSAPEALFTVLLAAIFLKERLTPKLMLAALIALGGVLILEFTGGFDGTHLGDLLVLAGILSASCYSIVARTIAPDNDALTMTAFQFAVSLVFITPFAAYQWATGGESIDTSISLAAWGAAIGVGVVGFALSFVLFNWALGYVSAGVAGMSLNLLPVFGLLTAVVLLGERITWAGILGGVCIVGAVAAFTREAEEEGIRAEEPALARPESEGVGFGPAKCEELEVTGPESRECDMPGLVVPRPLESEIE